MESAPFSAFKRPKFDFKLKAALAIVSNVILLLAVDIIHGLEDLLGKGQIAPMPLLIFNLLCLLQIVLYGVVVTSDTLRSLLGWLVRVARRGVREEDNSGKTSCRVSRNGVRLLCNLWVPVTLNFLLAGYLIYISGGITSSPFSQVPIAMMLIGQSVYEAPGIELRARARVPEPVLFLWEVARLYAYPLFLMAALLAGLLASQAYLPLETRSASPPEIAATAFVILFTSMCVTFVTRRADQQFSP